eukprot:c52781_g1_i1.p1 GENE.c52781_g1_i1~~c52781_g1_i1.p1  ORF type:complete len:217 (-),score=34.72 c52781_g1_i1:67-717(-)
MDATVDRSTLFFGVYPPGFVADCENAFNDYSCDGLDGIEKKLRLRVSATHGASLPAALSAVQGTLRAAGDKAFRTFEHAAMREVFAIPAGVTLPDDLRLLETTAADEARADATLAELRRQIAASRYITAAMASERAEVEDNTACLTALAREARQMSRLCMNHGLSLAKLPAAVRACADETTELTTLMRSLLESFDRLESLREPPPAAAVQMPERHV